MQGVDKGNMFRGEWIAKAKGRIVDFMNTIETLEGKKIDAINAMGFGTLHKIGCPDIFEDVCEMMMNNIDPHKQTVVIHGRSYEIKAIDFERVMGLKDGGVDIDFGWDVSDSLLSSVRNTLGGSSCGNITIGSLKNVLQNRKEIDIVFRAAYVMFAMSAVLCPVGDDEVDHMLLLPLLRTDLIKGLNWATMCYNKLRDVVMTMKLRPHMGRCVCLIFIQLFCLDVLGSSLGWVARGITPIMYWSVENATKLVDVISNEGGFGNIIKQRMVFTNNGYNWGAGFQHGENHGMHDDRTYEELKSVSRQLQCVTTDVKELKGKMNIIGPGFGEFINEFATFKMALRSFDGEAIKTMVSEMLKQYRQGIHENCDDKAIKPDKVAKEVKSNSAHFNGAKNDAGKGLLSGDSSCRIVSTMGTKGDTIQKDKVLIFI